MIARTHAHTNTLAAAASVALAISGHAIAQDATQPASSSLLASPPKAASTVGTQVTETHELRSLSMFAVAPGEARDFHEHDLIQIIVRETSEARSSHSLETEKETKYSGAVTQWPDLDLSKLLQGALTAGDTEDLPLVDLRFKKEFAGDGDYNRRDAFTARLTAEVIEILPNGNLVIEARTRLKTDDEESILKVTGICRPADVTPANTILSNQIHDLKVDKTTSGELRRANKKGLFTKILDALFAF